jgi:hypothetical protein
MSYRTYTRTTGNTYESSNSVPLFLQEDGEKKIDARRNELKVFVKLLREQPERILKSTCITLNPHTLDPNEVGEKQAKEIADWWKSQATLIDWLKWIKTNKHEVNGKYGNWSAGFMGSRWADCEINGRNCRVAFYHRKSDPLPFNIDEIVGGKYNYFLIIDPSH